MRKTIPNLQKTAVLNALESGTRLDGRKLDEYRPIKIEIGVLGRAEGSAIVHLGKTKVACGVKIGEMEPYPDSPDSGVLTSNAEIVPMSDPMVQTGPPSNNDIEIARVVDRGIRESKSIELEKLCITPGELVKTVFLDSYVLDLDGNAIDAAALGCIAALHNAEHEEFGKLPVVKKPIAISFAKIGKHIIVDPNKEEEEVLDARLMVTIEDNDNVCAMQKNGDGYFTKEEVMQCVDTAIKKSKELRKLLK